VHWLNFFKKYLFLFSPESPKHFPLPLNFLQLNFPLHVPFLYKFCMLYWAFNSYFDNANNIWCKVQNVNSALSFSSHSFSYCLLLSNIRIRSAIRDTLVFCNTERSRLAREGDMIYVLWWNSWRLFFSRWKGKEIYKKMSHLMNAVSNQGCSALNFITPRRSPPCVVVNIFNNISWSI
jgi:hypothetical protein